MEKILIISTGGTFNKIYNPKNGMLEIDKDARAVKELAKKWLCKFEILNIIGKDSLEMSNQDRLELLGTISQSNYEYILVIHGTDTIKITAEFLAEIFEDRIIVLTGAMKPFEIDSVEASLNFGMAVGFAKACEKNGVYICMNGLVEPWDKIEKNRALGRFERE